MSASPITTARSNRDQTFLFDRWRGLSGGIFETAAGTFLLFIAVRHFEAGASAKAWIATGSGMGLLLSPLAVHLIASLGWTCSVGATVAAVTSGIGFLIAAALPDLAPFVGGSLLALLSSSIAIPFLTQIYQDNYSAEERGTLFSRAVMIRILTAASFSQFAGWALASFFPSFRWLLFLYAGSQFFTAFCTAKLPSRSLPARQSAHPLHALRFVVSDAVFRRTLISWMFMGFANLMMMPLRVDYLANPRYGLAFAAGTVALFTGVIPNIVRLIFSPLWGWLFDRLNFFLLRIVINLGFCLGMVTFFTGNDWTGLSIGAIAFGASSAGGDLAWSLWVTKVAPPDRVADYMSVHTFLTGIRAMVAPFVGFYAATQVSLGSLGIFSAISIGIACAVLLPEARFKLQQKSIPLSEDFSE
jgi:MFS family permease